MKCVGKLIGYGVPKCHKESIIRTTDQKAADLIKKEGYIYVCKSE